MNAMLRWLLRTPVHLYHWHCGRLLGHRFLLLQHIGRRTGQRHETVLEVMEYREPGPELIVMSGFGPNANWLRNLEAAERAAVTIGVQHFVAVYRRLSVDEAMRVVETYERRNRLAAPIVRFVLGRLLGWKYRGTDTDRRRLAMQLPLIALSR
jgi:deazaflavin-dependent oxidoreductase (nitroreductase family)